LAREFVNPNLHVALLHFPIALLIAGTLVELFSFLYRRHAFRAAGRWMIFLGALSGIPTAMSGIYALADVSLETVPSAQPWDEAVAESALWQHPQRAHMMRDHVALQSWGVGVAVLAVVVWVGASDTWRARLHLPMLALLIIASGLTIAGSWHAGEAVYTYGVAVETEAATRPSMAEMVEPATAPAGAAETTRERIIRKAEYFAPPVQMHMIAAGVTVALAMASLALSFRAANSLPPRTDADNIAEALGPRDTPSGSASVVADLEREDRRRRRGEPQDAIPRVPSARFWLLTFLVGLLTAVGGLVVLAIDSQEWRPRELWSLVRVEVEGASPSWLTRRMAHLGGGLSIVVLSLLLALVSRVAARSKLTLLIFALLLLAAVAAQVWFGVLLTYDSIGGPVTRFN
jgi:uncharacterized membrane protein